MHCEFGETLLALPKGFLPLEQYPEFSIPLDDPFIHPTRIGKTPYGTRWGFWPFYLERYVSDTEPDLSLSHQTPPQHTRIGMWQRITRTDVPQGWHSFTKKPTRLEGFSTLSKEKDYFEIWSPKARHDRRRWHTKMLGEKYTLEWVDFATFASGYKKSRVMRITAGTRLSYIQAEYERDVSKKLVTFVCVRQKQTGAIVAGMGFLNSPSTGNSFSYLSFALPVIKADPVMTGIIDAWFQTIQREGYTYAHFGRFYFPGGPYRTKGFSLFKAKFNPSYIFYPPTLYRILKA